MTEKPDDQVEPDASTGLAERRAQPRFPAWLDGTLHGLVSPISNEATVVDLSASGASVTTTDPFDVGAQVQLQILRSEPALPARVIRVEDAWPAGLLHIQFEELSSDEEALLDRVLEELRSDFRDHRGFLAGLKPKP